MNMHNILYLGLPLERKSGISVAQRSLMNSLAGDVAITLLATDESRKITRYCDGTTRRYDFLEDALSGITPPDVIHVHSTIWSSVQGREGLAEVRATYPAPVLFSACSELDVQNRGQLDLLQQADTVHYLTDVQAQIGTEFTSAPYVVIPRGIAIPSSCINVRTPKTGVLSLLYVGRFSEEKGCVELAQAFARLPKGIAKLTLLGTDSSSGGCSSEMRAILTPVQDAVQWAGWTDATKVPDYFSQADLLVAPSHKESFGKSQLEAIANGCPVATSTIPTLTSIYQHGTPDAYAVPILAPVTPETILDAIRTFRDEQGHWLHRTIEARKMVRDRFSPERVATSYVEIYQRLAELPRQVVL